MLEVSLVRPRIKAADLHLWADYIELQCLASSDREAGAESLLREHWDARSGLASIGAAEGVSEGDEPSLESTELSDRFRLKLHDLFAHLVTRSSLFGDAYPFVVVPEDYTLMIKPDYGTLHELYVFFLLAGNLRFFDGTSKNQLTKDFEAVCADRIKTLFPSWFEFRIFGTSSHPEIPGYSGNKYSKLCQLAGDIKARIIAEEHEFNGCDTGDAGVDIVAWAPFDDAPHAPVFFMQCGCTSDDEEMFLKQDSVSRSRWCSIFANCFQYNLMCTPVCYRSADGVWPKPSEIRSAFIDRPRLMNICARPATTPIVALSSLELARQALSGPSTD